jgi:hypothetical protein
MVVNLSTTQVRTAVVILKLLARLFSLLGLLLNTAYANSRQARCDPTLRLFMFRLSLRAMNMAMKLAMAKFKLGLCHYMPRLPESFLNRTIDIIDI